ncbi:hypothetical protein LS74_009000 [Helicobacter magdeburgensis]|uniref:Sel1 repeat family protein n=1 Tax=Helicobacter magdeburgensis TaxID=471858 RepID=A0A4U8SWN4_9HELI|nr:hypothetical protein [Helicobacter magdeburgensis]TLD91370.1 hypothetical protein LS74_009000 [Helicobacter magdeburgensis]
MKKILMPIAIIVSVCGLFASVPQKQKPKKLYGFEHFYIASLPDGASKNIQQTPLYQEALSLYYNADKHKPEKFTYRENGKRVSKQVAFPDFEKVRKTFLKSYIEEGNKAAGFMAAYVHKNYGDTYNLKGQLEYFNNVAALAKDGNCFGYVESAKYFSEGIADISYNEKQALKILRIAEKKCANNPDYSKRIAKELLIHKNGFYKEKYEAKQKEKK